METIRLGNQTFILLPKLNTPQIRMMNSRLECLGFEIRIGDSMVARKPGQTLRLSPSGFCRSNFDPFDAVVPLIPDLLSSPKVRITEVEILGMYFRRSDSQGQSVRLSPRMERGGLWWELRSRGLSGLTPDEALVYSRVLAVASGTCTFLTDFPTRHSKMTLIGKRVFYKTELPVEQFAGMIGTMPGRVGRNVYLPENGMMNFTHQRDLSPADRSEIISNLGEWCTYEPY